MDKLRVILEKYSRWQPLSVYVDRIEGYIKTNFPFCVENSKALLESIAKEVCKQKNQVLAGDESVNKVLNLSFGCLGYPPSNALRQIGGAIATIGQQIGTYRNDIGITSHGKTLDELKNIQDNIESYTEDFLLTAVEIVACFLIEAFETLNPLVPPKEEIKYVDNPDFNEYWNDLYGEFQMSDRMSFSSSEILYKCEPTTYEIALNEFKQSINETDN